MKECIVCHRTHDESYVDRRYCCKRCKLEDFGGDKDAVEKNNVTQAKIRNYAVMGVLGFIACTVLYTAVRVLWGKLFH
jgi:endogenous inhibitor of DNA gyrase (YacG/DUF329 family)